MISKTLFWCAIISFGSMDAVQGATFRLFLGSCDKYIETPLEDPSAMYPHIDKKINITMYTGGFKSTANDTSIVKVIRTLISLNNTNVILLNWEKEAQGILPNILDYPAALISAKLVAEGAGKGIIKMMENGIEDIRLVGHSLGAHLMGWAAEKVQESQRNVSRTDDLMDTGDFAQTDINSGVSIIDADNSGICIIYGLDPVEPAVGGPISFKGLNPSQAPLVFVAHTNSGKYGTDEVCGTVDFWFNCENDGNQPGCPKGILLPFTPEDFCSHNIAWMFLLESLLNPGSFPAASAKSCCDWESQNCSDVIINHFGFDIDPSKRGNFYLSTNAQYPYSKGQNGITPN